MAQLTQAIIFFNDISGNVIPGSRHFFYSAGTSNPKSVYSDPDLTNPLAQPVIAASDGILPQIWLEAGAYRWVGQDENGNQFFDRDNINLFESEVNATSSIYFNSTSDMVLGNAINGESVNLQVGQVANTVYDTVPDDGGGLEYRIYSSDGGGDVPLANGNFARPTENGVQPGDITTAIDTHNTDPAAHADIRADVSQNTSDISTNATNIGINASLITTNISDIDDIEANFFKGFSFSSNENGVIQSQTTSYDGVTVSSISSSGSGRYTINFNQSVTLAGWTFQASEFAPDLGGFVNATSLTVNVAASSISVQVFNEVGVATSMPFGGSIFYQG